MADPDPPDSAVATTDAHDAGLRMVLMADRTPEAARLVAALREDGLSVMSCDIVVLPERAARLDPFAVVVDIEQPNAVPAVARLLDTPDRRTLIAAIGGAELARHLRLGAAERARLFERPVVVAHVRAFLADMAELDGHRLPAPRPGPRAAASSQGPMPLGPDSDAMVLSDFPAIVGLPEVESILPELETGPISTKMAGRLSPEIEALLDASARRVREQDPEQSAPLVEPNILVPPEMLAMVDDLLSPDEPPQTRGGMDLAGMLSGQPTSRRGPRSESRRTEPFDDEPVEAEAPPRGSEAPPSESPGTNIEDEETGIPGPGTQVGHSSPLESTAARTTAGASDRAPRSGSSPPQRTEAIARADEPRSGAELGDRSTRPGGSAPPTGTSAGPRRSEPRTMQLQVPPELVARREHADRPLSSAPTDPLRLRATSDEPPESAAGMSSDLAPLTRAGPPIFSSRHPAWRETAPPETSLGLPQLSDDQPPDSREATQGDPLALLASAVSSRLTGALVLSSLDGQRLRRVLMRDGDMVNAASEHPTDALVHFLVERGDLSPEVAELRTARLPLTGRHAAAALIANGFLGQDDLWPVLRAHAEWVIGRALRDAPALGRIERQPPERLRAEPNVFGGAAGVEVFIESIRRVLPAEEALERLGGRHAHIEEGPRIALLAESALSPEETELVGAVIGQSLERVLDPRNADIAAVLHALVSLQILSARAPSRRPASGGEHEVDPLDADAVRQRVRARMALVHEADYFALLGVSSLATSYEIRRAYVELRRTFEPARLLTAATADLQPDVALIVDMIDEAYQVLRDPHRRGRYRRAIEARSP